MRARILLLGFVSCAPVAPRAAMPYSVHLLGADDGALRGEVSARGAVFLGRAGREYAISAANDTPSDVGVSMLVDGLDAATGAPAASCEDSCHWVLPALREIVVRGFSVDDTSIATFRFTSPAAALASFTKGARREAIGTVETCFFSLRPSASQESETRFRGRLERELPAGTIVGERRPRARSETANAMCDRVLSRLVVRYRDAVGDSLGTAPPPAGIAPVIPPPPPRAPCPPAGSGSVPENVKPPKGWKPPK